MSSNCSVADGLETSYDILSFPAYEISAYVSVFHIATMAAAADGMRLRSGIMGEVRVSVRKNMERQITQIDSFYRDQDACSQAHAKFHLY